MDVQALRAAVEELVLAQAEEAWDAWYQASAWDPGAALARRPELFDPAAVRLARDEGDPLLARHLLWQSVALHTRPAVDRYVRARSTVAVRQADRTLLVGEVGRALAGEPDRGARRRLWDDFVPVLRLSAPAFLGVVEATTTAGVPHGFDDGFALACALTRIEPTHAVAAAEAVLQATDAPWRAAMALAADVGGVPSDDLRPHDLSWVLRGDEHEGAFAQAGALPLAGRTFAKLGIDLRAQADVETYADPHGASGRPPRAFALRVPGDIRIGASPRAGVSWLRGFFTELGRAQQLAHTASGAVTETFPLGLRGVTDAAGRLVAGWLADPGFLEANGMGATDAAAVVGHARLEALHEARTVAATTLWHHDLASGADPGEAWLARAPVTPDADDASALPDRLDAIYALDSLQMCLLTAATEHRLFSDHGERWWWSEDAGAALSAMWSQGQRKSAAEHVGDLVDGEGGLAAAAALL